MALRLRVLTSSALAVAAVLVLAGPAAADPPEPGNVRSTVTAITPDTPFLQADMVGADSFFRLHVDHGRPEVVVLGYEDEPYLRFRPDGTVEENQRSPAAYLNRTRTGDTLVPEGVSATAEPEWRAVASGGTHAWHDHRTHYMGRGTPRALVDWTVPLVVGGQVVTVSGRYEPVIAPSPLPWWLLALGVAAGLVVAGRRAPRAVAAAAVVAGGLTVLVGFAILAEPASGPPGWTTIALGAVAVLAAVAAGLVRRSEWSASLLAGAGVALLVAGVRRVAVLDHAVLPTELPPAVERASVALALGVGAAAVVVGGWALVRAFEPVREPAAAP